MVKLWIKEFPCWYWLRKSVKHRTDIFSVFCRDTQSRWVFFRSASKCQLHIRPTGDFPAGSLPSLYVSWALCKAQYSCFLLSRVVSQLRLSVRQGQRNGTFYLEPSFSKHHQPSPTQIIACLRISIY